MEDQKHTTASMDDERNKDMADAQWMGSDEQRLSALEERLMSRHAGRTYNFFRPVGQIIEHVDTINFKMGKDGTFHFENVGQVNGSMPQAPDPKGGGNAAASGGSGEVSMGTVKTDTGDAVADPCFWHNNEFATDQYRSVVNTYYHGVGANLALIMVTLYDHRQLKRRDNYRAFIKSLMAKGILTAEEVEDIDKLANTIAQKMRKLPQEGYREWGNDHLNDRLLCEEIGKSLDESMPYNR